jgi:ankyrin repeat protein
MEKKTIFVILLGLLFVSEMSLQKAAALPPDEVSNSDTHLQNKKVDKYGRSALHIAAFFGKLNEVQFLIDSKIDINLKDQFGCTALHFATIRGHVTVVKALIHAGADVDLTDGEGYTALRRAAQQEHVELVNILVIAGKADLPGWIDLFRYNYHCYQERLQSVIDGSTNVNLSDPVDGWTTLHYAASFGDINGLKALMYAGADVNLKDKRRQTALHKAAQYGQLNAVSTLLAAGADINAIDEQGATALLAAHPHKHPEIVRLLSHWHSPFGPLLSRGTSSNNPINQQID